MDPTQLAPRWREHWLKTLCDLVRIPSRSSDRGGEEGDVQRYVAQRMREAGLEPRLVQPDQVPGFFDHPLCCGPDRDYTDRPTVIVEMGPADAPALLLMAHSDTVQINDPDAWLSSPFDPVERDGAIYGLGAADDQWGVATILTLIAVLAPRRDTLSRRLIFATTVDEEYGVGNGLLLLMLILADVDVETALYLDGSDHKIMLGNLGGSNMILRPRNGTGLDPTHVQRLTQACARMSAERMTMFDHHPLLRSNPMRDWSVHLVPVDLFGAKQEIRINFYQLPDEPADALEDAVENMAKQALGPAIENYHQTIRTPWFEPALVDPDEPIVRHLASAIEQVSGRPAVLASNPKQDAFVFNRHAGIPTVSHGVTCLKGPGANHSPNERMNIESGWLGVRTAYQTIFNWLGKAGQ